MEWFQTTYNETLIGIEYDYIKATDCPRLKLIYEGMKTQKCNLLIQPLKIKLLKNL